MDWWFYMDIIYLPSVVGSHSDSSFSELVICKYSIARRASGVA